ncbi:ATP-binding protein [Jeotgalibacillus proteolyticus]|uniref:ATP-binding protein n=1 Tax=Jeotgalibacillus proteolyticus TaxID=2082395 RepID=A0A2S5G9J1_9BACL|nr:ATP-binding protein [Jeotgalibacillus proteolyticus]PPA69658.1 ATP-binding protein [Jeotgalibacillus proteolyticus]
MKKVSTGRNALTLQAGPAEWIMATDNSGAIGEKEYDEIKTPYHVVSYFSFRSAVLDCLSAGALPKAVLLHNFCGNNAWNSLVEGIQNGVRELGLSSITITGSTESNIVLSQSAIAVTVMGERVREFSIKPEDSLKWTLIGEPLVGMEVLMYPERIAPLQTAIDTFKDDQTAILWPVGSNGIRQEWKNLCAQQGLPESDPPFSANLDQSAGPSTCFIAGKRS